MKRLAITAAILMAALPIVVLAGDETGLAPEAAQALAHPTEVTLYSLEPTIKPAPPTHSLDRFTVLGEAPLSAVEADEAIAAFRDALDHSAILDEHGNYVVLIATCFEPRHAISVESGGHRFDYLLCYACRGLEVFRDGKLVSDVPAGGSPAALNALLKAKGLPLSTSVGEHPP